MSEYSGPPAYRGSEGHDPYRPPPPNNLVWAILSTILCCLPLGIVSIVFAAQVNSKWSAGDYTGAVESSRKAKQWAILSAVVGLLVAVLWVVLALGGLVMMPPTTSDL